MWRLSQLAILGCVLALVPLAAAAEFVCAGPSTDLTGALAKSSGAPAAPPLSSHGQIHALVVFAGFADEVDGAAALPLFTSSLFAPQLPGSLTHFFRTMSCDQFSLSGTALSARIQAPESASYYLGSGSGSADRFAWDILQRLDATVDLAQFDADGPDGAPDSGDDDGLVDYLFIVLKRVPPGFIRGAATGVAGLGFGEFPTKEAARSGGQLRISASKNRLCLIEQGSFAQTVGGMAHEFTHALGLPDLYDTDYQGPEDDSAGIGRWGLMGWGAHGWNGSDGPVPLCAWSREQLGWLGPGNERVVEVTAPIHLRLTDVFTGGRVLKVFLPPRLYSRSDGQGVAAEPGYLLVEHRTRAGTPYDAHLPAEGLLVWQVQPRRYDNVLEERKLVDLVCADGLYHQDGGQRQPAPMDGADDLDRWAHDAAYCQAHLGNQGDAGDPFDGVERTELSAASNPAVGSLAAFDPGVSPLLLRCHRDGAAMEVELAPPRWAGTITRETHWAGVVLVDGDVRVAPGAEVVLHWDTQVRVLPGDRLAAGRDPTQAEVLVEGGLRAAAQERRDQEPITMAAADSGGSWYGLVVDPQAGALVDLPLGALQVRDARAGILILGAPAGADGVRLGKVRVDDAAVGAQAGNADGRLQPGESVSLVVPVENWSISRAEDVLLALRWDQGLLADTWPGVAKGTGGQLTQRFDVAIGQPHVVTVPVLTVGDAAVTPLVLRAELQAGGHRSVQQLEVAMDAADETLPQVAMRVGGAASGLSDQLVVSAADDVPVAVAVDAGAAAAVELVAFSVEQQAVVAEVPLARQPDGTFGGSLRLSGADRISVRPRVHSLAEAVFFGPSALLLEVPFARWGNVLVVGDPGPIASAKLDTALAAFKLEANYLSSAQTRLLTPDLLSRYAGPGRAMLWLLSASAKFDPLLSAFLDQGGNLLAAGLGLHRQFSTGLLARLGARRVVTATRQPLLLAATQQPVAGSTAHATITEATPDAIPFLLDATGQVAGVRCSSDSSRSIYLPLDPGLLTSSELGSLLALCVDYLLSAPSATAVSAATAPVPPAAGTVALWPAYPNPANSTVTVPFCLKEAGQVKLRVYDVSGQAVITLTQGLLPAGWHTAVWNGRDQQERPVATGIFLLRLECRDQIRTRKLLLLR